MTSPYEYPNDHFRHQSDRDMRKEKLRHTIAVIRNILNLVFMLVAIAGMVSFFYNKELSTMLICVAIVLKFAESAMRILRI